MAERARKAKLQENFEGLIRRSGSVGNAMWPLHMILAGMHEAGAPGGTSTELGVDVDTVKAVQDTFGWTVSFSRALQEGGDAMRAWFTNLGVDVLEIEQQFQCFSQEPAARQLCGASVEDTGMTGVSRVRSTYRCAAADDAASSDGTRSTITSLLMHAPFFETPEDSAKLSFEWKRLRTAGGKATAIPVVFPQLHGNRPALAAGEFASCYHIPLVFSAPRIMLAVRFAECMGGKSMGVQLTGVHGSGKSVLLQALANVLPSGYPADVFLGSNSKLLLESPNKFSRVFATSSGPLVDPRLSLSNIVGGANTADDGAEASDLSLHTHQSVVQREWSNGKLHSATEHKSLQQTVAGFLTPPWEPRLHPGHCIAQSAFKIFQDDNVPRRSTVAKVLILDEVNEVLRLTAGKRDSSDGGTPSSLDGVWNSNIAWYMSPGGRTKQIFAASPDGLREKVHERSDEHPFFELRPTRSDHLASVLAAAPDFIVPVEYHGTAAIKSCAAGESELQRAMEACRELCGNMRYVAKYAARMSQSAADTPQRHKAALRQAVDEYISVLSSRLAQQSVSTAGQFGRDPDMLLRLAAENASLIVRREALRRDGQVDTIGFAAYRTLRVYLQKNSHLVKSFPPRERRALASMFVSERVQRLSGAEFEDEIEARLMLQAVSGRMWRMDQLPMIAKDLGWPKSGKDSKQSTGMKELASLHHKHDFFEEGTGGLGEKGKYLAAATQVHPALWCKPGKDLSNSGPLECLESSRCGQTSRVDGEVFEAAATSNRDDSASLLIRTVHNFPAVDFVVLHRDQETKKRTVVFCETTVSQLKTHAASSAPDIVPQALRDIHKLTVQEFHWSRHATTGEHWISTKTDTSRPKGKHWTQEEPTSIANMWLSVLGCPRRISGSFSTSADSGVSQLVVEMDPSVGVDVPDADMWDVRIVYLSGAVEQLSTYKELAALESDMVYSVNGLDLNQAGAAWAQQPSRASSGP